MIPKVELLRTIITKVFEVKVDNREFIVKQIQSGKEQIIRYEISEDLGNILRPKIHKAIQEFKDKPICNGCHKYVKDSEIGSIEDFGVVCKKCISDSLKDEGS